MTRKGKKQEERKVRSSDFAMYQTANSRPTGLHHIFDSFYHDATAYGTGDQSRDGRSDDASSAFSQSQAELLKALEKLTKKDGTTKLKAIEHLISLLDDTPDYVLEGLVPDFMHLFKRIAVVEPSRKIRLHLGQALSRIAKTLKKRMQVHMDGIVTYWWMAMHDDAPDVASAYIEAFHSLFSAPDAERTELDRKTFRVLTHYIQTIANTSLMLLSRNIEEYKRDWMDTFGKTCDNSATISDMHNRLVCSLLQGIVNLMTQQRLFANEVDGDKLPVTVFVNDELVNRIGSLCLNGTFRQRLASARLLVELVKVLPAGKLPIARKLFGIGMKRVHEDEEAHISYQHVRLICACARYNSACWEPSILGNYASFVKRVLEQHTGDSAVTAELYSLCPCLVSYLPQEWLRSPSGEQAVLEVIKYVLHLLSEKLQANYEKSYAYDVKMLSQVGSSMLYCYYRILMLLEGNCETIAQHAIAPILELPYESTSLAKHLLSQLPRIFTEFIEEAEAMKSSEAIDTILTMLRKVDEKQVNGVLMTRIFDSLSKGGHNDVEDVEPRDSIKSYVRNAQKGLKSRIMEDELPSVLMEFLAEPQSPSCVERMDEMLSVADSITTLSKDSGILVAPRFFMERKYHDSWEFEGAFAKLSRVLKLFEPLLNEPEKYYPEETDAKSVLLVSLVALQNTDSDDKAVNIAKKVYSCLTELGDGNCLAVFLKFVNASQRFSHCLSQTMLGWLMQPEHLNVATCEAVYSAVDVSSLDAEGLLKYELLHTVLRFERKTAVKGYKPKEHGMVDDVVAFYLVGYYTNLLVRIDTLLNFSVALLPEWQQGKSTADSDRLKSFLQLLQRGKDTFKYSHDTSSEVVLNKDLVNAMISLQSTPCRCTVSISRTISALTQASVLVDAVIHHRNAVLFAQLWYMNCEAYLFVADETSKLHRDTEAVNGTATQSDDDTAKGDEVAASKIHGDKVDLQNFASVLVPTLVNDGFNYPLFEKLVEKVLKSCACSDTITTTLVKYICSKTWKSKFEYTNKIQLFNSYLHKLGAYDESVVALFKQQYCSNQFVGGFVATSKRMGNVAITTADDILSAVELCGEDDIVLMTNYLLELAPLFGNSFVNGDGKFDVKEGCDVSYLTEKMVSVPLAVLGKLRILKHKDACTSFWLHSALLDLFHACSCLVKALSLDSAAFLKFVEGGWIMSALSFCCRNLSAPSHLVINLFAEIMHLCISNEIVSLKVLRVDRGAYDFSLSSLREYADVMEALSAENVAQALAEGPFGTTVDSIDPHYFVSMVVYFVESVDSQKTVVGHDADDIQRALKTLKAATYEFVSFLSKSQSCYIYSLAFVSRLWCCSFLFSHIAEYSGTLCNVDLEHNSVYLLLPGKFAAVETSPDVHNAVNQEGVPIDISQLLLNALQDPEENGHPGDAEEPSTDNPEEVPVGPTREEIAYFGRKAISFYFNVLFGPHITGALFKTYDVFGDSCHHQDLELCLTSWLSAFMLLQHLVESNQLTLKNAILKVLTANPSEAGGAMYESIKAQVSNAVADEGKEYVSAWWLSDAPAIPEHADESALHVLLNVLILCLENLYLKEERYRHLVKTLYYKVSKVFPEEVNHVWNQCKSVYVKKQIKKFTKTEITQRLIADELRALKACKSSALHITHDADYRNLYASLDTKAEVSIKLTVKIPKAFPLEPLSFTSTEDAATFKNKHLRWLMMAQSAANRGGISQGLLLWSDNITKFFDGIEECPICYSIVHLQFNSIPGKTCKVCKHKFHTECLYKWFRNAQKAKCPLCQSTSSFTSYN
ncbi:E3 ubiquitin-protein ligase l [Babesia bigemina]|uniref:E3 ubiquitin-protein ligase listerin n=1 Tax=Babesia bigemina TaxID=5866 RepID=A0A061D611_BABBI|nr:E3 ubiquitin-protein ligase l [Babesia bigemina]CDR96146.1 E3 ubiquitin-protein ligase l [Babesia bigemina]|eukprot:XP_012768332.1 E3 ubiquitin-protein ligase l [Babesia bigemina]